jgi:hypothetical protein
LSDQLFQLVDQPRTNDKLKFRRDLAGLRESGANDPTDISCPIAPEFEWTPASIA